jgi:hypothetical protein
MVSWHVAFWPVARPNVTARDTWSKAAHLTVAGKQRERGERDGAPISPPRAHPVALLHLLDCTS